MLGVQHSDSESLCLTLSLDDKVVQIHDHMEENATWVLSAGVVFPVVSTF